MSVKELGRLGQSVWLDYIRRDLLRSGEFAALVRDDGVSGVTSNPSIFEKALAGSEDYDATIADNASRSALEIYEQIAIEDVQAAADELRPRYDETQGADGFACLEVSPLLAHDTAGTIDEARRLWRRLGRDNVMIKVPATQAGIPAIRQLISEGIHVNVTLLFSRAVYAQVAEAHLAGLEAWRSRGGAPGAVSGVASFFVSRVDAAIDSLLGEQRPEDLRGAVAIANARLAYQDWKQLTRGPRWLALADEGARPQRLLWASVGTKDPQLSDVLYVESLIGAETVTTVPLVTLSAFRDHGRARVSVEDDLDGARAIIDSLPGLGISLSDVTDRLLVDGVGQFRRALEGLLATIEEEKRAHARH